MKWTAILAILAVVPMTVSATALPWHERGAGTSSCGTWIADRRHQPSHVAAIADEDWILGFLSGVGFADEGRVDPLNGVDSDGVFVWLDNYCQAHPLVEITDAAIAFVMAHPR